ncbi:MAG: cytochrome P450, partial [Steroidobacteraceae bacterium]|nr:cytochrome P450 [Steroidobacteraceae bacterium]
MSTVIDQATGYEYHDVDFGLEDVPDLEARLARLLAAGKRVVKVRYIGKPAWVLLGHKEVWDAFLDTEHYPCSAAHLRHSEPTMGRNLLCLDGEEHRIKRALVAPAFQPAKIREYTESLLRPLANRLIDDFRGRNELDLVAQYTRRLPLQVITRLLDIPAEDEPQLIEWIDGLFLYPWNPQLALKARAEVTNFFLPIIHQRRAAPGDDLISMITTAEFEGHKLTDEEVLAFVRLLFPAGSDTTYLTLGSMMNHVLDDAELKAQVLADPALIPKVVDESLRLFSTTALLPRYTETGMDYDGVHIPPHSWVMFGIRAANRDPSVFDEPDRFDSARSQRKSLAFSVGTHACLGMHLARAEMQVSLELLLRRLPGLRLRDG